MKKIVFSVIFLMVVIFVFGAMAESVVDMPFGLKWTRSFSPSSGVTFGMTQNEVLKNAIDGVDYIYDDSGLLSTVVIKNPVKKFDDANSDYHSIENRLNDLYGNELGVELPHVSVPVLDEMQASGISKHSNRMIVEGKDKLITIEHYLFSTQRDVAENHYEILVYSRYDSIEAQSMLEWYVKYSN